MMSGELEISPGQQQTFQQTIKINNFRWFTEFQEEFQSKDIEVFPGKKIAFVIKTLDTFRGYPISQYSLTDGNLVDFTGDDQIFTLGLVAAESALPLKLAGMVEITFGTNKLTFNFGDHQNGEYIKIAGYDKNLKITPNPRIIKKIENGRSHSGDSVASLIHVKLSAAGEDATMDIKFTLHSPGEITEKMEVHLPESLESQHYVSELNTKIMADESTADLKISCGEWDNKKIFNVHKNFFCASSPVFRAAIESDMVEIYIREVDVKTVLEMIYYVYTGDFTGADLNVQSVAWVANEYNLPGMMDLLCFRMTGDVEDENIADMLIAAGRHESDQLKKIAMDKLRKKREILTNSAFRGKLQNYPNILFELIQEL